MNRIAPRLGQAFGVDIFVHWTFFTVPLVVVAVSTANGAAVDVTALWLSFVAAVFACVLVHEFSHALIAKLLGIHCYDIILLPIGGVIRMEPLFGRPRREMAIALAGPAANTLIAGLILTVALASGWPLVPAFPILGVHFWVALMWVNAGLAAVNLVPALPMDGGRVVRAILCMVLTADRSTLVSGRLGQLLGLITVAAGVVLRQWWLPPLGLFAFFAAGYEIHQMNQVRQRRHILKELTRWVVEGQRIPDLEQRQWPEPPGRFYG